VSIAVPGDAFLVLRWVFMKSCATFFHILAMFV